jgi:hypothetical protein
MIDHEANRFASAFLTPRGSVLAHVPTLPSVNLLVQLKFHWVVSVFGPCLPAAQHRRADGLALPQAVH